METKTLLTSEELTKFNEVAFNSNCIITTQFKIDIGRNRVLVISDIGTPSGFIHLIEKDDDDLFGDDIVVLYNYDYDGDYYVEDLKSLYFGLTRKELI